MPPIILPPPLNCDSHNEDRHANGRNPDHAMIENAALAGEAVDRLGRCNV
jgi:hypothetical protein